MMKYIYLLVLMVSLFLAACQSNTPTQCDPTITDCETVLNETSNASTTTNENVSESNATLSAPDKSDVIATFKEGDLIKLRNDLATDPDGDVLKYTYSAPLDANGEWQTAIGDAGIYDITIKVSDGVLTTVRSFKIEVLAVNHAPVISEFSDITVDEGDKIVLKPVVTDSDNDKVTVTFDGWLQADTYQTTYTDAGEYNVTLVANDGKSIATKTITVTVKNVNRAPVLASIEDVLATEGELITIKPQATDADNDALIYTFGKPLSEDGTWQTSEGDAGDYDVTVSVTDGEFSATKNVRVVVETVNQPPVILLSDVTVKEGETVELEPVISDPNGDDIIVTFDGWMRSSTKNTEFGDAGEYNVTVTASDGREFTSKTIMVTVEKVNRPPVFADGDWFN